MTHLTRQTETVGSDAVYLISQNVVFRDTLVTKPLKRRLTNDYFFLQPHFPFIDGQCVTCASPSVIVITAVRGTTANRQASAPILNVLAALCTTDGTTLINR